MLETIKGTTINVTKEWIPQLPKIPYRHGRAKPEGIVFHCTSSAGRPDLAGQEATYEARTWNQAFVHFFVDDKKIIQVADTDYIAWGCGSVGNSRFLQIELCMFDVQEKNPFIKAYSQYLQLAATLLLRYRLEPKGVAPYGTLWSHQDVSKYLGGTTHTDPIAYLSSHGISWAQHLANVHHAYSQLQKKQRFISVTGWFHSLSEAEAAASRIKEMTGWNSHAMFDEDW